MSAVLRPTFLHVVAYYFVLVLRFLTFNFFLLGLSLILYPCKPLVNVAVQADLSMNMIYELRTIFRNSNVIGSQRM